MSAMKKVTSGFVNPMDLQKTLQERAGAEPLQLEPQATAPQRTKSPALPLQVQLPTELPWEGTNPRIKIHFGLRIPEPLHKRFEYAANHTLGESMQTFALKALEEAVSKRLSELGFD